MEGWYAMTILTITGKSWSALEGKCIEFFSKSVDLSFLFSDSLPGGTTGTIHGVQSTGKLNETIPVHF